MSTWIRSPSILILLSIAFGLVLPIIGLDLTGTYCSSPIQESGDNKHSEDAKKGTSPIEEEISNADKKSPIVKFLRSLYQAQETHYKGESAKPTKHGWWHTFACDMKISDFFIATFTLWLVIVTAWLIYMARSQERHLRDTAQKELRAYVSAVSIRITTEGFIHPVIEVKNHGKTTAYGVLVRAYTYDADGISRDAKDLLAPFSETQYNGSGTRLLYPGQEWESFQNAQTSSIILSEDGFFFIIGEITYRDIYDRYWVSIFNFYHQGRGNLQPWGDEKVNCEKGPYKYPPKS